MAKKTIPKLKGTLPGITIYKLDSGRYSFEARLCSEHLGRFNDLLSAGVAVVKYKDSERDRVHARKGKEYSMDSMLRDIELNRGVNVPMDNGSPR